MTRNDLSTAKILSKVFELADTYNLQIIWEPRYDQPVESVLVRVQGKLEDGVICHSIEELIGCVYGFVMGINQIDKLP